ncbi:unnamed protein product [Schistocephalus solidus]|uniref:Uncharacterized protein n=1 Tax=Schistocephalus solidus TaxID=70667 RepID=A0A183SB57_SCHSO|nr:unnamed protein product [Schistocephalus solidus]
MDQHLHTQSASPHETPIPTVRESHRSLRHSVLPRKPVPQEHDSGREARAITEEYRRSELCELLPPGSPNRVSPSPSLEFSPLPPPLPPADGSTVPSRKSKRLSSQAPPPPTSVAATAPLLNGDLQSDRFGHHHLNPLSCGSNVGAPSSMSVSSRSPSTGPPSQLGLQSIAEGDEDDVATSPSPPSSPESGFSMAKPEASTVTAPLRATKRNHQRIFRHYNNYSGGGGSGSAGKRRLGNSEHLSHLADPYALSSELDEGSDQFEKSASLVPVGVLPCLSCMYLDLMIVQCRVSQAVAYASGLFVTFSHSNQVTVGLTTLGQRVAAPDLDILHLTLTARTNRCLGTQLLFAYNRIAGIFGFRRLSATGF